MFPNAMRTVVLLFLSAASVALGDVVEQSIQEVYLLQLTCSPEDDLWRTWSLSLRKFQNISGHWADLSMTADDSVPSNADGVSDLEVTATSFDVDGKKMIRLEGTIRDPIFFPNQNHAELVKPVDDRLRFHEITSENTVLSNHGLTAKKVEKIKHGAVLSHRTLKPNEIFEVKIDETVPENKYGNAMGVTTHSPNDIHLINHMNSLKSGTWMLYHSQLWLNGSMLTGRYMQKSLDKLKVGDRLGVMRTDEGVLHFFINGVDQGPAFSGIPENVYGVYEFYGDTSQVTTVCSS